MAQVTLNKKSWHFEYYSLVVSDTPPKSLCPYFWTMVALIILSPIIGIILFCGFVMKHTTAFFDSVVPKKEKKTRTVEEFEQEWIAKRVKAEKKAQFWNKVGDHTATVSRWVFLPGVIIAVIYLAYRSLINVGWYEFLVSVGVGIVLILMLIGFVYLIETFGGRVGRFFLLILKVINPLNWKSVKILGEMINAAYTKACPIITWNENTIQNDKVN